MGLETCPHCNSQVIPTSENLCPDCHRDIHEVPVAELVEAQDTEPEIAVLEPPNALAEPFPLRVYDKETRRKQMSFLIAWMIWGSLCGFVVGSYVDGPYWRGLYSLGLLDGIASAVVAVGWSHLDADARNFHQWKFFPLTVLLCMPVAMLVYFIRTRGFDQGIVSSCVGVLVIGGQSFLAVLSFFFGMHLGPA